jgi:hypothetical protein
MPTMQTLTVMTRVGACSFSASPRIGYKFTGKERDSESGLDNFEARYLGSSLGRFMSSFGPADAVFGGGTDNGANAPQGDIGSIPASNTPIQNSNIGHFPF